MAAPTARKASRGSTCDGCGGRLQLHRAVEVTPGEFICGQCYDDTRLKVEDMAW